MPHISSRLSTGRAWSRRLAAGTALTVALTGVGLASSAAVENLGTIAVGIQPVGVAFTPDGQQALVANAGSGTVSLVDVVTWSVAGSVNVGVQPQGVAISPAGDIAYVANATSGSVSVIDIATFAVVDTITTGAYSTDVAFTLDGAKAYVSNLLAKTISVIDVASGTVIDTLDNTPYSPNSLEVTPDGATMLATNSNGIVSVIDLATDTITPDTVLVQNLPTDVEISPNGALAYVPNNSSDSVSVIDMDALSVIATITVGDQPTGVAFSGDGTTAYVSIAGDDTVAVIDVATGTVVDALAAGGAPREVAISPDGTIFVPNYDSASVSVFVEPVRRLTGTNRYGTAIKVSQAGFPAGADVVFVATGTDYPDALAAGPAAAEMGGPVILTENTALYPEVKAEIERLDPQQIYVVGGVDRVSAAIQTQLNAIAPTQRITGTNRYETSRLIADLAFGTVPQVYVATGLNFPDALAAGAAGAVYGAPVILVNGTAPAVDPATLNLLTAFGNRTVTVVGGTNMVSDGIKNQLGATRITGTNRYETALEINKAAYAGDSALRAILATGVIFPDALSASAWAGRIDAPLYLAPTSCVPQGVLDHMTELGVVQVTLVGGPDRLTQSVFDLVAC